VDKVAMKLLTFLIADLGATLVGLKIITIGARS
jgi:hypothetical protein